jgi:hypothetical protein
LLAFAQPCTLQGRSRIGVKLGAALQYAHAGNPIALCDADQAFQWLADHTFAGLNARCSRCLRVAQPQGHFTGKQAQREHGVIHLQHEKVGLCVQPQRAGARAKRNVREWGGAQLGTLANHLVALYRGPGPGIGVEHPGGTHNIGNG